MVGADEEPQSPPRARTRAESGEETLQSAEAQSRRENPAARRHRPPVEDRAAGHDGAEASTHGDDDDGPAQRARHRERGVGATAIPSAIRRVEGSGSGEGGDHGEEETTGTGAAVDD